MYDDKCQQCERCIMGKMKILLKVSRVSFIATSADRSLLIRRRDLLFGGGNFSSLLL